MRQNHEKYPQTEKPLKVRLPSKRRFQYSPENNQIESEQHDRAQKSPFLRKRRENKIGFVFGKKFEARLDSLSDHGAPKSPPAHGDHGLQGVIPRPPRISG